MQDFDLFYAKSYYKGITFFFNRKYFFKYNDLFFASYRFFNLTPSIFESNRPKECLADFLPDQKLGKQSSPDAKSCCKYMLKDDKSASTCKSNQTDFLIIFKGTLPNRNVFSKQRCRDEAHKQFLYWKDYQKKQKACSKLGIGINSMAKLEKNRSYR